MFVPLLGFALDYLGQDFQIVIVAFVGNLESNNLLHSFGGPGKLLVDKARELTGLCRKTVEVLVELCHFSIYVLCDFLVCNVELLSQVFESFFEGLEVIGVHFGACPGQLDAVLHFLDDLVLCCTYLVSVNLPGCPQLAAS